MKFTFAAGERPLEGFTIKAALGRGGFGEVYRAVSDGGKELALKHVQANLDVELRGVGLCLNLKHPNLLALFDVRQTPGEDWWVVMEYVAGESLDHAIANHPDGMPYELAMDWLTGICGGVGYLHDNGLVHRDLKPANVFVDDGMVKVGDYGLSKFMTTSRRSGQTGSIGTVHYMAPEVSKGRYGKEIDLYSIGVMLYEMLTGKLPFDGETAGEVLMKHLTAEPDLSPLPANVQPVVGRLLAKDPAERYHHVSEVLKDLGVSLPIAPTPSMWRGEIRRESPMVLPVAPPLPRPAVAARTLTMPWWLRFLLSMFVTGGITCFAIGIMLGMFRMRGDHVPLMAIGLGFLTAGTSLAVLRTWAWRRGLDKPAWLSNRLPIPRRAMLGWAFVGALLGIGAGMWFGGIVDGMFRRSEGSAALMGVGLGFSVFAVAFVLQRLELMRLRGPSSVHAPQTGWLVGRVVFGLVVGVGVALFFSGLVSLATRSEAVPVLMGLCLGTATFSLLLLRLGIRLPSILGVGACWAVLMGILSGLAFAGITRHDDAGAAIGVGTGILTFTLVLLTALWYHHRRQRWRATHPSAPMPKFGSWLFDKTAHWSRQAL